MINKIIKDWVGENQDEIKAHNESMEEKWRVLGYNQAKAELRATIPQLTERIEKEIRGDQTIASLFSGKKIIKSKMLPKDEIWVGEGPTRSEMLKPHQLLITPSKEVRRNKIWK